MSRTDWEGVGVLSSESRWGLFVVCCGLLLSELFWRDNVILYKWEYYFILLIDFRFQREDFEE